MYDSAGIRSKTEERDGFMVGVLRRARAIEDPERISAGAIAAWQAHEARLVSRCSS